MSDHIVSYWTQFRRDKNQVNEYILVNILSFLYECFLKK